MQRALPSGCADLTLPTLGRPTMPAARPLATVLRPCAQNGGSNSAGQRYSHFFHGSLPTLTFAPNTICEYMFDVISADVCIGSWSTLADLVRRQPSMLSIAEYVSTLSMAERRAHHSRGRASVHAAWGDSAHEGVGGVQGVRGALVHEGALRERGSLGA
eukprot:351251-Chlamydomonas_euryale.AAC.3